MPPLAKDSRSADKTRITWEIETGWSVLEDGAVDPVDESGVIEVIYRARRSRNDVGNSLRKVRIPPDTEVQGQAWLDLPRIGRIGVDVYLICLMLIRLTLEKRR